MTAARTLGLAVVVMILAGTAWLGLWEGYDGLHDAETLGQRAAAWCQFVYGLAATAALVALSRRSRWLLWPLVMWGIAASATAMLATVYWGGSPWRPAVLAGLGTALVTALVGWGATRVRR